MEVGIRKQESPVPCPNCGTPTFTIMVCSECGNKFCGDCFIGIKANDEMVKCPVCKAKLHLPIRKKEEKHSQI